MVLSFLGLSGSSGQNLGYVSSDDESSSDGAEDEPAAPLEGSVQISGVEDVPIAAARPLQFEQRRIFGQLWQRGREDRIELCGRVNLSGSSN